MCLWSALHAHPEMRTEAMRMILDDKRYHIDNCKQYVWCVGIFKNCLTFAHHRLHSTSTNTQVNCWSVAEFRWKTNSMTENAAISISKKNITKWCLQKTTKYSMYPPNDDNNGSSTEAHCANAASPGSVDGAVTRRVLLKQHLWWINWHFGHFCWLYGHAGQWKMQDVKLPDNEKNNRII